MASVVVLCVSSKQRLNPAEASWRAPSRNTVAKTMLHVIGAFFMMVIYYEKYKLSTYNGASVLKFCLKVLIPTSPWK